LEAGCASGRGQEEYLLIEVGVDFLPGRVGVKVLQALAVSMNESRLQRLTDLLGRHSRFGTYPHSKPGPARAIDRLRVHHRRKEDVGHFAGLSSNEAFGRDADDFKPVVSHAERLSNGVGVAVEAARPVVVAQDRHRIRTGCQIVVGREQPAKRR
jgi:hypothetical protein